MIEPTYTKKERCETLHISPNKSIESNYFISKWINSMVPLKVLPLISAK